MALDEILQFLNDNGGALNFFITLVFVVLTYLLLRESRLERLTSDVIVEPEPFGRGMYAVLGIRNLGPNVARAVRVEAWESDASGNRIGKVLTYHEGYLHSKQVRRMFPDKQNPSGPRSLEELAAADVRLDARWSWEDGRRRFFVLPVRHKEHRTWQYDYYRAGLASGEILADRTDEEQVDRIASALEKIDSHLTALGVKRRP